MQPAGPVRPARTRTAAHRQPDRRSCEPSPLRRIRWALLSLLVVAFATLLPAGTALAAPATPTITSVEVVGTGPVQSSSLVVQFDAPLTTDQAAAVLSDLTGGGAVTQQNGASLVAQVPVAQSTGEGSAAVTNAGPQGQRLLCNNYYRWSDANGVFTLQHQCRGTTAPWGFWLSSLLKGRVVGLVHETGMNWVKNGVRQPRMAPHDVGPAYLFHGTFSNSPDGTSISYDDHFLFRHNIGSGGNADLRIFGSFVLTGTAPPPVCQPGKPC